MSTLRLILGDQLSHSVSSLKDSEKSKDVILMCEVWEEATHIKHHKKKIAFIFAAMRHFAIELKDKGYRVYYTQLDDPDNAGSFSGEVERFLQNHSIEKIVVTHPSELRVLNMIEQWQTDFNLPVEIRDDDRFLCSKEAFAEWANGRKQLRMEYFYREMRKQYQVLIKDGQPAGGQWNFDSENRKRPKDNLDIPQPYGCPVDSVTQEVIDLVGERFASHFGDLEPFHFAVTRQQALAVLDAFISTRLSQFGDYQDAMLQGQPWMFHSHISFYLNCGLLLPLECVQAAEAAYQQGAAPLNAVEGFIRQIMGWREYVRGIYWLKMPDYRSANFFAADRDLPEFYWTGETELNCLHQCIKETQQNAYAHHIQRLMVLGNFALLTGIDPAQVNEWYWIVYADAYEWVELPNVSGMILFADGGYLASKPYAAGGSYIHKMSNYCKSCRYKVNEKSGPDACPFNYLYWDFLDRNRERLESNRRIAMMYKTFDRMDSKKKQAIRKDSEAFLKTVLRIH